MKAASQQRPAEGRGATWSPERANTRFSYLHYSYSLEHETAALLCACSTKISERSLCRSVCRSVLHVSPNLRVRFVVVANGAERAAD